MTDPLRQELAARFQAHLLSIEVSLAQIPEGWTRFVAPIAGLLARAPHQGWWGEYIEQHEDAIAKVQRLVGEIGTKLAQTCDARDAEVTRAGDVSTLFAVADSLETDGWAGIHELSKDMPPSDKISRWKSDARTTFDMRVTEQIDKTNSVADNFLGLAKWLDLFGGANATYLEGVDRQMTDIADRVSRPPLAESGDAEADVLELIAILQEMQHGIDAAINEIEQRRRKLNSDITDAENSFYRRRDDGTGSLADSVPNHDDGSLIGDGWPKAVNR